MSDKDDVKVELLQHISQFNMQQTAANTSQWHNLHA